MLGDGGPVPIGPPQDRPDSRHQLPRAERLGHVVVGAEVQAEEQVVLGGARRQHDDRGVGLRAQDPADVEPVDARHHHVEHKQVRTAAPRLVQGGSSVVRDDNRVPFALEVAADELGLLVVVLGDEDPGSHDHRVFAGTCQEPVKSADLTATSQVLHNRRPHAVGHDELANTIVLPLAVACVAGLAISGCGINGAPPEGADPEQTDRQRRRGAEPADRVPRRRTRASPAASGW